MAITSMYTLTIPGKPAIEISQDELRSLLGQIETELHRSKVYRRAINTLQTMLGDSADHAKVLFKAVSREAISLAFRQFAEHKETKDINENLGENKENIDKVDKVDKLDKVDNKKENSDLSECLISTNNIKFQSLSTVVESPIQGNSTQSTAKKQISNQINKKSARWFQGKNKISKAEIAKKQAIAHRLETMRQIGKQLREAREARGLSLEQLQMYTHMPIHHMDSVENGNLEPLPEDVYVRGFIRVMGNALGLNGTILAASLPSPDAKKAVLPTYYKPTTNSPSINLSVRPVHLYVGYTALVTGAVGGLSLMSHQTNSEKLLLNIDTSSSSPEVSNSLKHQEPSATPGLQSKGNAVNVGNGISAPEAFN
jgi:cytoskeleton protein RodZ